MAIPALASKDYSITLGPLAGPCCSKPGEVVKGTFFLGGAGLNGSYIPKVIRELHHAGIKSAIYLDKDKWSAGKPFDITSSIKLARRYDPSFSMLLRLYKNYYSQFNLIGYSYGSVLVAQLAMKYALKGSRIDHLVLIGCPISRHFLSMLHSQVNIRKIIVIDLDQQGDPIYAGMTTWELAKNVNKLRKQMSRSDGHFYFVPESKTGDDRRKALAHYIYQAGLR